MAACACALLGLLAAPALARAASPRITLGRPRAYQVIQRKVSGRGSILVTGRIRNLSGPVQIHWGANPWLTVKRRRDGVFRVRYPVRGPGQATLTVRAARHHSVWTRRAFVGVGDVYVIAGQSNASGRSALRFSVPRASGLVASLFGNDDRWRRLRDPVDSPAGQVDVVSRDRYAGGSVWPLVAGELMAAEPVPVAFVPCAKGTTPIARWLPEPEAPRSVDTLYGSLLRRVKAVGAVRAVLFWQGENDARHLTPGEAYENSLRTLAADISRDCRAPLVAAQIGDYDAPRYSAAGIDAIRLAQQRAWEHPALVAGPALYDIDLHGEVHFLDAADVKVAARRWTAAVLAGALGREPASRPRLRAAVWDGERTVTLLVDPGPLPLLPGPVGGIIVRGEGGEVEVVDEAVTAADTVTVTLAEVPDGQLTVTLGSGHTAAGAQVPVEDSSWRLPLSMFVDEPVAGVNP